MNMLITSENARGRHSAVCAHAWHKAYTEALNESDSEKLMGRIEYALIAIERRYAQWCADPGTPAERMAIIKCISTLKRLLGQEQVLRYGTVPSTPASQEPVAGFPKPGVKSVEPRRITKEMIGRIVVHS